MGWYWWLHGSRVRRRYGKGGGPGVNSSGKTENDRQVKGNTDEGMKNVLQVTRLKRKTGLNLIVVFVFLYFLMWQILSRFTDSPVPGWDSFITSLSIVATWMLARKIFEHWFVWILVNIVSAVLFFNRGLHPTVILYVIYAIMSVTGLFVWKKAIPE
jgi:nicotinamide mononucleotide transporter